MQQRPHITIIIAIIITVFCQRLTIIITISVDGAVSSSPEEARMEMGYASRGSGFGMLYYRSLLEDRGILYVDQQLTVGEETENWVGAYASAVSLFRKDFAVAMMKLSNLSCSKVS
ncbi:hypothetical protein ACSBR2_023402 [Camellia fascicularis]